MYFSLFGHHSINDPVTPYFEPPVRVKAPNQLSPSEIRVLHGILDCLLGTVLYSENLELGYKARSYYSLRLLRQSLRLWIEGLLEGEPFARGYLFLAPRDTLPHLFIGEHKGDLERLFELFNPLD
jgi:hypothetical protein